MTIQSQVVFKHENSTTQREFENVYKQLRALFKCMRLDVSEIEPAKKMPGLRWFKPTADTLKEWTGSEWKQLYPGVFDS